MRMLVRGLQGKQDYTLDDKGRVAVAQRFRDLLGDSFHVMRAIANPCLVLLSDADKEELDNKFSGVSQFDEEMWEFIGWLYSGMYSCTPDKQNRITIPSDLREYADLKLNTTVVISGANSRVEIWNADAYEARRATLEKTDSEKRAALFARAKAEYKL